MPNDKGCALIDFNICMYHRYKHQRATKHIIELYEASFVDRVAEAESVQKAMAASSQLDNLNSRIRQLNKESNLPDDLGVIEYGAFLYGWRQMRDGRISPDMLESFCKQKQYMKGWSCLPPRHEYGYFPIQTRQWNKEWDIITHWLSLIWCMLRWNLSLELIDQLENTLLGYVSNINSIIEDRKHTDTLSVLFSLHKMKRCLNTGADQVALDLAREYKEEREKLRSMCAFHGYPSEWLPGDFDVK